MRDFYQQVINLVKPINFYLPLILSLLMNALIWLFLLWRLPATTNWIPLHFNTYFGIDWIGPWIQIFIYPVIGFLVIIINLIVNLLVYNKERSLIHILNYSSLLVQVIILTGLFTLFIRYFV